MVVHGDHEGCSKHYYYSSVKKMNQLEIGFFVGFVAGLFAHAYLVRDIIYKRTSRNKAKEREEEFLKDATMPGKREWRVSV